MEELREEKREAVRYSNRPMALLLFLGALGVLGLLVLSADRGEDSANEFTPAPTSTTTTPAVTPVPTDPTRGLQPAFWWLEELGRGEQNGRVRPVDDEHPILLSDQRDRSGTLRPQLRRVDMDRQEVIWKAGGREATVWREVDPVLVDGTVMMPDRPTVIDYQAPLLWGFDFETGEVRWAVRFRNDVVVEDNKFATIVDVDGEPIVLLRVGAGRLQRIDPKNGFTLWDVELLDAQLAQVGAGDDSLLEVLTPGRHMTMDPENGMVVATAFVAVPPPDPLLTESDLAVDAGPVERWELGETTLLWWSYPDDLEGRNPGIALVDADGQVLWEDHGRSNSTWQSERTNTRGQSSRTFFVEGVVIKADRGNEPNSNGALVAFDLATGSRLWVSQFRVPIESTSGGVTVSMHLRSGEEVIITRTIGLGLVRVSPNTGSPMWSTDVPEGRVAGSFRRNDGSEVIAIATESENLFLDVVTGDPVPLSG